MARLHQQEWEKARTSLTSAANEGIDIPTVFSKSYQSVEGFEKKAGVKLPKDIAAMLREKKEQIYTSPIEKNPAEFQSGMELYSLEAFAAMSPQRAEQPQTPSIPINLLQPPSQTSPNLFAS